MLAAGALTAIFFVGAAAIAGSVASSRGSTLVKLALAALFTLLGRKGLATFSGTIFGGDDDKSGTAREEKGSEAEENTSHGVHSRY